MAKEIIAIDIDDVLAHENDAMRDFVNREYGLDLTADDYSVEAPYWGYWEHVWGVDKEEGLKRFQAFLDSGVKADLKVVDGALIAIKRLKKDYDLTIVTARNDQLIDITHKWLERHFPSVFRRVEFVHLWNGDSRATKANICREIGASYLIDDNLEHCTLAAEAGLQALLFGNYGWNRGQKLTDNIHRIEGWAGVLEYFYAKDR